MKKGWLLVAIVAISGCAALRSPPTTEISWTEREVRLLTLSDWHARGRIAVKGEAGGGQGDMQWQQHGQTSHIRVSGPFGAGAYEIRWEPALLTVTSRNGEFSRAYSGPDAAEQFLAEQLGWSFPAASTRYWMLGVLDPEAPGDEYRAPDGYLIGLSQNGWSVTYERFVQTAGMPMPAKLTLQNDRARVRMVIDRWELEPTRAATN
jgi:outer membrane lipoprotein LolB